ncbi:hypothetical protein [Streptomyces sp. GbtcB6]|uniref:hypothetical protein n=1 Tax=Streptomyces sp. GbtcB6 TaxID=2824751 RepID=UPI001C3001FD|nr:hypothetical protein [Streptomyces sp. GbtcB6]
MTGGDAATGRTDLSDLLRTRKEELGLSYRELEAACIDPAHPKAGIQYRRGTLENLVKAVPGTKAPTYSQLHALEAAFRLPLQLLQDAAAAQFFGLDAVRDEEDPETVAFMHDFQGLSADDQAWVRAMVQTRRNIDQS